MAAIQAFARLPSVVEALQKSPERHGELQNVVPGRVWAVEGRFLMRATMGKLADLGLTYLSRTMTVVKDEDGLVLVNAFDLTQRGWDEIEKLGQVRRVVRLSSSHGSDDPILLDRFKAEYWIIDGMSKHHGLEDILDQPLQLMSAENTPVTGAKLFVFPNTALPEGILVLPIAGGVLVSCDGLQNQPCGLCRCDPNSTMLMNLVTYMMGFQGHGRVGPGFLMGNYKSRNLDPQVELPAFLAKVLSAGWDAFVPGHGGPIAHGAKQMVAATLRAQFPSLCALVDFDESD